MQFFVRFVYFFSFALKDNYDGNLHDFGIGRFLRPAHFDAPVHLKTTKLRKQFSCLNIYLNIWFAQRTEMQKKNDHSEKNGSQHLTKQGRSRQEQEKKKKTFP